MAEMDWNMVYRMEVLCTMPPCKRGQCIRVRSISKSKSSSPPGSARERTGVEWAGSGDEVMLLDSGGAM
jgi:hypothetical protein